MEQKKKDIKPISYRPSAEVREFLEGNAAKSYRSIQGMLDFFMARVMEMERKGEIAIH
ncbi:TPA: hypothetical protein ACM81K_005104 [Escherichia coli]|uniref:hypothetical protein n=1 Tax=Escherichia coli TaxID=562 RepID=UPI0016B9EBAB|nr:hypothetical protein [Escherichia coli]EFB6294676.1 hypothetical protein [Escherichia coli]EFG2193264.1 hypothetical protein [Escherichia coli]EFH3606503.1 hypothetical protein [Escherichia coli]EFJ5697197.1 hypothetical protein [Escherichia coli]EFJ5726668.1 hypothetical protein [Escherichia coli]